MSGPRGRPKGTKNTKYHSAGGSRLGSGRKRKDYATNNRSIFEFVTRVANSNEQSSESDMHSSNSNNRLGTTSTDAASESNII